MEIKETDKEHVQISLQRFTHLVRQDAILRRKEEYESKEPRLIAGFTMDILAYLNKYHRAPGHELTIDILNEDIRFAWVLSLDGNRQVQLAKKGSKE